MVQHRTPVPAAPQGQRRPAAHLRAARGRQRPVLHGPLRLLLADAAPRLPALGPGQLLLLHLARQRPDREAPRHPARGPAPAGRPRADAQRGRRGQSDGQDDGGRGAAGVRRGKKTTGRKRHLLVDTLGLIWGLVVTPADVQDRDAARPLLESVKDQLPRLLVVWADGAYAAVALWAATACHFVVTTILRPLGVKGFVVLPKRWIVERTFAWLGRYRRLSKDYEANPKSSEAWI